jgi:hypothetical protein
LLLLVSAQPVWAGQKRVTLYLDGARVEQEVSASGGYLELPLPESFLPGSLRVKPLGEASVLRVELVPPERDHRRAREIARLEEKVSELQDRMQALSRQEEIFSAAVKSQSGKAPRKTKTNPDPVSSLQRGTEFALSQLESVFRGQRKCRRALEAAEQELAAARKGAAVARLWLSGERAKLSYAMSAQRWVPSYDFRWSGTAVGELVLHARIPAAEKGTQYQVSSGKLAQGLPAQAVRGDFPVLSRYPLTLASLPSAGEIPGSFTFSRPEAGLPAGEAAAYWRGEYLGCGHYPGAGAAEFNLGR